MRMKSLSPKFLERPATGREFSANGTWEIITRSGRSTRVSTRLGGVGCAVATRWAGSRGFAWIWGREHMSSFNAYHAPNSPHPDVSRNGAGWFAARSFHPRSVHVGMADASAHRVRDTIDLMHWRALATRSGREPNRSP